MKAIDLKKNLSPNKNRSVGDLARIIKNRADLNPNFCLFLGAGASRTSGISTAAELVKDWRSEAYQFYSGNDHNVVSEQDQIDWLAENQPSWYKRKNEYSSLFEYKYQLPRHRRTFIEKQVSSKLPSIGYAYLVRIAEASFVRTVFTTNFDDLINEAFYQFSSERPILCAHDSSVTNISLTSTRPKIIKLHGDYLFDNIRCTNEDTSKLNLNMDEKFRQFLKEYGLIISGYSGSDRSILDILEDLLRQEDYIQNGLYWCFREDDCVSDELYQILEKDRAFFVITEGYDELMAELYDLLCENLAPFTSQIATDRPQNVIDTYLTNESIRNSKSPIIRKHLEALEKEQKSSEFFSAIQELNADMKLTNFEFLRFLKIERTIQSRDFEGALQNIQEEILKCDDQRFKKILLGRMYLCAKRLNKTVEALEAANRLLQMEPNHVYILINKVDVLANYKDRLATLEETINQNGYVHQILNRLAREKISLREFCTDECEKPSDQEIELLIEKSITSYPGIRNPAWGIKFDFIKKKVKSQSKPELEAIIDEHLKQDPYSYRTVGLLLDYCKLIKIPNYKEIPLFTYLKEAFSRHLPRNYAMHFSVFSESCIEFEQYAILRELVDECDHISDLQEDADYISSKITLLLDVYRDIDGAIALADDFLEKNKSRDIEEELLKLLIKKGNITRSWDLHKTLRGVIDYGKFCDYQSEIYERDNKFQDAIDSLFLIPNKEFFHEKYSTNISFLYLKQKNYAKAREVCAELLRRHNFSSAYQSEILNYEYAKMQLGKKPSLERLHEIIKNPDSETIKAVAHTLSGEHDIAFKILEKEIEKRFSTYYDIIRWPALEILHDRIEKLSFNLIENRRTTSSRPNIGP